MNEQEMNQKFAVFEQQIQAINSQLEAIEQAISDLKSINSGLNELQGKKDSEIQALIGRGIYVQAKLLSEELLVNIGNNKLVKKSIPETQKLINNQLEKLKQSQEQLNNELEKINSELTKIFMESQKEKNSQEVKNE